MDEDTTQALESLLEVQCQRTEDLLKLLRQEQRQLSKSKPQNLTKLTHKKQQVLDSLHAGDKQCHRLLGTTQPKCTTIKAYMERCPANRQKKLAKLCTRAESLLQKVRDQNAINGTLIAASQQATRHKLLHST